jgi:hypothetical protein
VPNINDVFPSKYINANDLKGQEPVVTIREVLFEPVGRSREMKGVVYFTGKVKGLILNKTNAKSIMALTGSAVTEEWVGKAIRLYTAETEYDGKLSPCVRIKASNGARPPALPVAEPVIQLREPGDEQPDYRQPVKLSDIPF